MKLGEKLTYEDVNKLPEGNYEVIDGEVVESAPTGFEHGEYELDLGSFLRKELKDKGYVAVGEVGILISKDPLRIRSANVVYISKERSPQKPKGVLETPPELVIEIVSPTNTYSEMEEKVIDYVRAGVDRVLLIDPQVRQATLFEKRRKEAKLFGFDEEFEIIQGVKVKLSEVLS
ncbi:Uma2 family endonuclease [Hydrogenivirga sp.]